MQAFCRDRLIVVSTRRGMAVQRSLICTRSHTALKFYLVLSTGYSGIKREYRRTISISIPFLTSHAPFQNAHQTVQIIPLRFLISTIQYFSSAIHLLAAKRFF